MNRGCAKERKRQKARDFEKVSGEGGEEKMGPVNGGMHESKVEMGKRGERDRAQQRRGREKGKEEKDA